MALTLLDKDLNIIAKLEDEPNDEQGMGAPEFKAKFDEAANLIQNYINKTLIPELESDIDAAAQGVGSGGGIDGSKILNNSMDGSKVKDGSLGTTKFANNSMTTEKYAKGSVTREILSEDAKLIQTEDLPNRVVPGRALDDSAVTSVKIENGAVVTEKVAPNAVSEEVKVTFGKDGWKENSGRFEQSVSAEISEDDKVIADIELSGLTTEEEEAAIEAWGNCRRIVVGADGVVATFTEKPETDISVILLRLKR